MPTILIGGYYGAGNVGDEAILAAMVAELRNNCPEHLALAFIVLSLDPKKTSHDLDVESILWGDINAMVTAAQRSDLIIVGGGGIFHDSWGIDPNSYLRKGFWDITAFGSLTLLAKLLDIPCMIYGVGIGPLQTNLARQHTRQAFERCQVATIRDDESLALLETTGFNAKNPSGPLVKVLPDPVYALTTSTTDDAQVTAYLEKNGIAPETALLGISLRYWDKPGPPEEWLPSVAVEVRDFLETNNNVHVIGIPFQTNEATPFTNDIPTLNQLAELINLPDRVHIFKEPFSVPFVQALIKRCRVLLSMRLHGIIMGVNVGTPSVALASWPKIISAMKMAGLKRFCNASLVPKTGVLKAQLQTSWEQRSKISQRMKPLSGELKQKTVEYSRLAFNLLSRSKRSELNFSQEFALEQIRLLQKADEVKDLQEKQRFQLQTRVWELEIKAQTREIENSQLQSLVRDLEKKLQTQELESSQLQTLVRDIGTMAQTREIENSQLQSLVRDLEKKLQTQETETSQLQTLARNLEADIQNKIIESQQPNAHVLELEARAQNQESELQRLRAKLAEIESSRFWRIALTYYYLMGNTPLHYLHDIAVKLKHILWAVFRKRKPMHMPAPESFVKIVDPVADPMHTILVKMKAKPLKGFFIITSAFVFDEFYNQRVTNFAKYLANEGLGVLYVVWRWSKEEIIPGSGEEVYPNLFQIPVDIFLEQIGELEAVETARKYFVVEFPHPEFFVAAIRLRRYGFPIVYEIIDDWEEFHKVGQSPWYVKSTEDALVLNANVLTAVSQPLVDKFAGIRRDIHLSPNGFNPALLGEGRQDKAQKKFQRPEIHVGYFGHLTEAWFDWDLVLRVVDLARERGEEVHFELIGYGNPDLEKRLEKYGDKVRLHGKVQPGELHKYACEWDVAMIPFKKGKLSQAVDPLKIYEYLYFGLGVIVTGIEHLSALPRVEVVGDAEEFLGALVRMREAALEGTSDKGEARVAEVLEGATWDRRFSQLVEMLEAGKWMSL